MLLNKFRGSLVGVLLGDCLGSPFEGTEIVGKTHVNIYFHQLLDPKLRVPYKPFTDDTAMTRSVAESLLNNNGFNAEDMARRFTTQYFLEPKRGYGAAVHDVFVGLRMNGFEDPFYAAKKQFNGQGSFGNGAAMRVSPIALFAHKNISQLTEITENTSRITHANDLAIRGALLQCFAVRQALLLDSSDKKLDTEKFIDSLIKKMQELENENSKQDEFLKLDGAEEEFRRSYVKKLKTVKEFLAKPSPPSLEDIHNELGVHVAALHSVPTAIYCFLLAQNPIPDIKADNHFLRSVMFAVSLGGDTDTIASMAASIAGAYLGLENIPKDLLRHCEDVESMLKLAEDLYNAVEEKKQVSATQKK